MFGAIGLTWPRNALTANLANRRTQPGCPLPRCRKTVADNSEYRVRKTGAVCAWTGHIARFGRATT